MSTGTTNLPRRMVPRWRDYITATALGECHPVHERRTAILQPANYQDILDLWVTCKTTALAGELLSAALAAGELPEAEEASRFLLDQKDASPIAQNLARHFLGGSVTEIDSLPYAGNLVDKQSEISSLRHALREYPNDALAWCELSRWYSITGSNDRARKAMLTAIGISEPVRYVLRSAIRCFLHLGEKEMAHRLAHRSPLVRRDPWIAAAALSTSSIIGKSPRYYKDARSIAKNDNTPLSQRSELLAALGTLHLDSGNGKRSLRAFRLALKSPTENVLAQSSWAVYNKHMTLTLAPESLDIPLAFEARTFEKMQSGDWVESLAASKQWISDEGFAGRPAVQSAFILSVAFEDYQNSIPVLRKAMRTNIDDPLVLNNLAFCYASLGDTEMARNILGRIEHISIDRRMSIVTEATMGLTLFREGRSADGRLAYQKAMEKAAALQLQPVRAQAAYFLAREERLVNSMTAKSTEENAIKLLKKSNDPVSRLMAQILKKGHLQLPKEQSLSRP